MIYFEYISSGKHATYTSTTETMFWPSCLSPVCLLTYSCSRLENPSNKAAGGLEIVFPSMNLKKGRCEEDKSGPEADLESPTICPGWL